MDQKLDVDEIWRTLRPWGRYQLRQLSVMWMGMMPCVIHLMIVVFIGFRPRFICNVDNIVIGNDSRVVAGECHMNLYTNSSNKTINEKLTCNSGYKYNTHKDISFVTEWDLVCDNAQWAEVSQALVLFGQGFGGFIFTGFSDKFGRKPVHITSHICLFLLTMSLTVIPNYTVFAIARFFIGAMIEGLLLTCATQYVETLPLEWRFCAEVIGLAAWTTGIILVTPFAYLMRFMSWRYLQLVMSLLSVYSLVEYWLFDESLRWLMANGKLKEAERVIRKAARLNNLQFDDVIKTVKREMAEKLQISSGVDVKKSSLEYKEDSKTAVVHLNMDEDDKASVEILQTIDNVDQYQVKKYSMLTILKTRRILLNSIIIWITWITNSLTYYGLTLISASLTGDRFLNYFFLGAIEYISSTLEFLLLNRIGRQRSIMLFLSIAGFSLLTATLISSFSDNLGGLATFFVIIGKCGITGSFSSVFLYTPELYPTNLRNAGYGYASVAARVGGTLAPFAGTLGSYVKWGPGVVFTSLCLLSFFLMMYLPETMGKQLPTTIEELKAWYKANRGIKFREKKKNENNTTEKN